MRKRQFLNRIFFHAVFLFCVVYYPVSMANKAEFKYLSNGEIYRYSVAQTGENYTFEFNKSPGNDNAKLKAGFYVLKSIYKDSSINKTYSERYIRERARCYMIDSNFYTYSLCFLPNDFNKKDKDRFWGFVTQMPNWRWQASFFFLPVLLFFALVFYFTRNQKGE